VPLKGLEKGEKKIDGKKKLSRGYEVSRGTEALG